MRVYLLLKVILWCPKGDYCTCHVSVWFCLKLYNIYLQSVMERNGSKFLWNSLLCCTDKVSELYILVSDNGSFSWHKRNHEVWRKDTFSLYCNWKWKIYIASLHKHSFLPCHVWTRCIQACLWEWKIERVPWWQPDRKTLAHYRLHSTTKTWKGRITGHFCQSWIISMTVKYLVVFKQTSSSKSSISCEVVQDLCRHWSSWSWTFVRNM